MTVMSVAMLAAICQMPDLRESSFAMLTPQSHEVKPRKLSRQLPLKTEPEVSAFWVLS